MKAHTHLSIAALLLISFSAFGAAPGLQPAGIVAVGTQINPRRIVSVDPALAAEYVTLAGRRVNPLTARDQTGNAVSMAAAARVTADDLRLVQFTRPLDGAAAAALAQQGLAVLGAIPDNTFIIKVAPDKVAGVRAMSGVRWVGNYAPEYRYSDLLQQALRGRAATLATIRLRVFPVAGADLKALAAKVGSLGESAQDAQTVLVTLPTDGISKIAALPDVLLLDYAPLNEVNNSVAADIVDARDMWRTRNFTGSNEIVAVADSGLDIGVNTTAIHKDFQDNAGATRIAQIYDNLGDSASDPYSGHGTHVSGSVLGNGVLSGAWPQTNGFPSTCYAGMAPKARLVFQAQGSNDPAVANNIYLPTGILGLFNQAYSAGARIHQDSWGSDAYGSYTSQARDLDTFLFNNPMMFACFSSGNAGVDLSPTDGIIDLGSVGSPGTAKNCMTVGASENVRNTTEPGTWGASWPADYPIAPINPDPIANAPTGMAAFSSRGPCSDGRIKPEIVAPGTFIASVRTHAASLATPILQAFFRG